MLDSISSSTDSKKAQNTMETISKEHQVSPISFEWRKHLIR